MYKVTYTHEKSPDGTNANHPPIGFREITQESYAKCGLPYGVPAFIEYRQILKENTEIKMQGGFLSVVLNWYNDKTGCAIAIDNLKTRYFTFGCEHYYKEIDRNHIKCERCGHGEYIDSSD